MPTNDQQDNVDWVKGFDHGYSMADVDPELNDTSDDYRRGIEAGRRSADTEKTRPLYPNA